MLYLETISRRCVKKTVMHMSKPTLMNNIQILHTR